MDRDLEPQEIRVLGCLLEKEATTPDQYPLSINALVQACNQKSNREPVMALAEADVRATVGALTRRGLVRQASSYGGRVSRFEHRLGRGPGSALDATPEQLALLCLLFLRGPQTPGELRSRGQRLASLPDIGAVEETLQGLAEHPQGALIERMSREPGKREARYRHCLGGEMDAAVAADGEAPPPEAPGAEAPLTERVARLERAVQALQARLDRGEGEA